MVLVGDIHRGGVIASLIGTFAVLETTDADRIVGTLINKFHGDPTLFVTTSYRGLWLHVRELGGIV